MPYYSLRFFNGTQKQFVEAREIFDGKKPDNTGHINYFYVERSYDLATMRRNAQGVADTLGEGRLEVDVEEIEEDTFYWWRK